MLDVMVILTFFLIFTAVFSKTSVLEVQPARPGRARRRRPMPTLELEVIVRRSGLEVADRNSRRARDASADGDGPGRRAALGVPESVKANVSRTRRTRRCWSPRTSTTTRSCR